MVRRLPNRPGMMHRPFVLFMDQPTVGLDPQGAENLMGLRPLIEDRQSMKHCLEENDG